MSEKTFLTSIGGVLPNDICISNTALKSCKVQKKQQKKQIIYPQ